MITITNPGPIMAAELPTVGAAIRILVAGGSKLTEGEMQRASGATQYVWNSKGRDIMDLVEALGQAEAA